MLSGALGFSHGSVVGQRFADEVKARPQGWCCAECPLRAFCRGCPCYALSLKVQPKCHDMTPARWFQLKWSTMIMYDSLYDHTTIWFHPISISEGNITREMRNDKKSSPVHGHQHSGWPSQPARVRELAFSGGALGALGVLRHFPSWLAVSTSFFMLQGLGLLMQCFECHWISWCQLMSIVTSWLFLLLSDCQISKRKLRPACGQAVFSKHPQQVGWKGLLLGQSWENEKTSTLSLLDTQKPFAFDLYRLYTSFFYLSNFNFF